LEIQFLGFCKLIIENRLWFGLSKNDNTVYHADLVVEQLKSRLHVFCPAYGRWDSAVSKCLCGELILILASE
jgi:hypothetical protein